MPNRFHCRAAIQRRACLADRSNPLHVSFAAASKLAKELSPVNPCHVRLPTGFSYSNAS